MPQVNLFVPFPHGDLNPPIWMPMAMPEESPFAPEIEPTALSAPAPENASEDRGRYAELPLFHFTPCNNDQGAPSAVGHIPLSFIFRF